MQRFRRAGAILSCGACVLALAASACAQDFGSVGGGADRSAAMLRSENPAMRLAAVKMLRNSTDPKAASLLVGALDDPDEQIGAAAREALQSMGGRAVAAYADALRGPDARVRLLVVKLLSVRDGEPSRAALELAARDALWPIRQAAIERLWVQRPLPRDLLLRAVKDDAAAVRMAVLAATAHLQKPSPEDPQTISELLAAALGDANPLIRRYAADRLREAGSHTAAGLQAALSSPSADARAAAAEALWSRADPCAAQAMAAAAGDADWRVRRVAAVLLSRIDLQTPQAAGLIADQSVEVRLAAVQALQGSRMDEQAVALLAQAAADADTQVRRAAVEALGRIGSASCIPPLGGAARDASAAVAFAAIHGLRTIDMPGCAAAISGALDATDEAVRQAAVEAAAALGDPAAADVLLRATADASATVRRKAAVALAGQDDRRAIEPLVAAIRRGLSSSDAAEVFGALARMDADAPEAYEYALRHDYAPVRMAAVAALARAKDARTLPMLVASLQSKEHDEPRWAAALLGQLGDRRAVDPLIRAVRDSSGDLRDAAADALGELGDPKAVKPLVEAGLCRAAVRLALASGRAAAELADSTPGRQTSWEELRALAYAGPAAVGPLKRSFRAAEPAGRSQVVSAMAALRCPVAVEPLIQALSDLEGDGLATAAAALGELGDRRAVEPLAAALPRAKDQALAAIARALALLGDDRAIEPIRRQVQALGTRSTTATPDFAADLERLGTPKARDALIEMLNGPSTSFAGAAAGALGRMGDAAAMPALTRALGGRSEYVQAAAARAIDELGERVPTAALIGLLGSSSPWAQEIASALLAKDAAETTPAVAVALQSSSDAGKAAAVRLLAGLGGAEAAKALRLAATDASSGKVRAAAIRALSGSGDRSILPVLLTAASDTDKETREAALAALGTFDDPKALGVLLTAAADADATVNRLAAVGLGGQSDPRAIEALTRLFTPGREGVWQSAGRSLLAKGGLAAATVLSDPRCLRLQYMNGRFRFDDLAAAPRKAVVEALQKHLAAADTKDRVEAAWALCDLGDRTCLPALAKALMDPDWNVRNATANAMLALGDEGGRPCLRDRNSGGYLPAWDRIADSRADRDPQRIRNLMVAELAGSRRRPATSLLDALGRLRIAEAAAPLAELLKRQMNLEYSTTECVGICRTLGRIGDAGAGAALRDALNSTCPPVRSAAAEALADLRDRQAVEPLIQSLRRAVLSRGPQAEQISAALVRLADPRAADAMVQMLGPAHLATAALLTAVDDPRAFDSLSRVLRLRGTYFRFEGYAAASLDRSRGGKPLEALLKLLQTGRRATRAEVAMFLGYVPRKEAAEALVSHRADPDAEVRFEAKQALLSLLARPGEPLPLSADPPGPRTADLEADRRLVRQRIEQDGFQFAPPYLRRPWLRPTL